MYRNSVIFIVLLVFIQRKKQPNILSRLSVIGNLSFKIGFKKMNVTKRVSLTEETNERFFLLEYEPLPLGHRLPTARKKWFCHIE
jgi:hypothetical protein